MKFAKIADCRFFTTFAVVNLWRKIAFYLPAKIFAGVVGVRNRLFDCGWLRSEKFEIPVICIGNITVGGTGKTPHTEFLLRLFSDKKTAVLSRGYKRRTKGFVLADSTSTARELGDEPFQIHQKFPQAIIAVDEKRAHGIRQLLQLPQPPEVILLDDAFQHRYVTPSYSIVLIDSNRPTDTDDFLPLGRLRDSQKSLRRADCIIITKCAPDYKPEHELWRKRLHLSDEQKLYFSTFDYEPEQAVFPEKAQPFAHENLLLVTGIVSPDALRNHLAQTATHIETLAFADHHDFSAEDFAKIERRFAQLPNPKSIVVTEKDKARLLCNPHLPETLKPYIYAVGIRVRLLADETDFVQQFQF